MRWYGLQAMPAPVGGEPLPPGNFCTAGL